MSGAIPFFCIDPVWRSPTPYCSTKEDHSSLRQSDSLVPSLLRPRFGLNPCGFEGDNPLRLERTTPLRAHGAFTFKSLFRRASMRKASVPLFLLSFALFATSTMGQKAATPNAKVPDLINFSGTLTDLNGNPLTGVQGVTFLLYKEEQGGAPVWIETQNITPDKNGKYTVTLGSTKLDASLSDSFANGEARWLGVQISGQEQQPRVLLVSVPYAMKAGDAETIGGLPPSAFVLANSG